MAIPCGVNSCGRIQAIIFRKSELVERALVTNDAKRVALRLPEGVSGRPKKFVLLGVGVGIVEGGGAVVVGLPV